mgnify:CR=1 FL=1
MNIIFINYYRYDVYIYYLIVSVLSLCKKRSKTYIYEWGWAKELSFGGEGLGKIGGDNTVPQYL